MRLRSLVCVGRTVVEVRPRAGSTERQPPDQVQKAPERVESELPKGGSLVRGSSLERYFALELLSSGSWLTAEMFLSKATSLGSHLCH
jgi:hypothetical protein